MTTPAERQRVLDKLGELYGFPYRPYTTEEWMTARGDLPLSPTDCGRPTTEHTDQGEQIVLPGAERSARQAAAARENQGRGKLRPRKPQKDPGGLFATNETEQPELFSSTPIVRRLRAI